jgi:tubulin delta
MSGALLATDQAAVAPLRGMQDQAYEMLAARAYLHQYEKYGLQAAELHECFAQVEEIVGRYALL